MTKMSNLVLLNDLKSFSTSAEQVFGAGAFRTLGRSSLMSAGVLFAVLGIGTASAEWWVQDREARQTLKEISARTGNMENVNKNLDDLREQNRIQGEVYKPAKDEKTKSKVAEAPTHRNEATLAQQQCGGKMLADQKAVCDEIVAIDKAQYKYMQEMRELSVARENELQEIMREREQIGEYEYGKLQSNTNRLLALMAHQRIDQLNMENAQSTFDERKQNRQQQQNSLAEKAFNPSKDPLGALVDVGVKTAVLKGALQMAKARDR